MLRSLYVMLDYHIAATDGELGRVQDFLFDDESWMIHYLVVETGNPRHSRKVLIAPFVLGEPEWESKQIPVILTCTQVLESLQADSCKRSLGEYELGLEQPGSHLRSMREVVGYSIYAQDGEVGSIEDFIVEDTLWGVHHVIVGLTHVPVRSIIMSPASIRSISLRGKAAWVNLSLQDVERSPEFDPAVPVNHHEYRLYDYYGRPVYSLLPSGSGSWSGTRQH